MSEMPPSHIQDHIDLIAKHEQEFLAQRTRTERLGDTVASFAGSFRFVLFHLVAFATWIVWNTHPRFRAFDPFPFSLLGTLVALEGIILASFILMRQARIGRRSDERDHLMLQILLLTEKEITALLKMDRQIAQQVGLDRVANAPEVKALSQHTSRTWRRRSGRAWKSASELAVLAIPRPGKGTMFVSLTRLRIRSVWFLPRFAVHALRSNSQVKKAAGFLSGGLLPDRSFTFWTMTAWESEAAMRAYMISGAHKQAMPHLMHWCDEASVAHWTQDDTQLPSWEDADRRMRETGRPSKVIHPSVSHASLGYEAPRTTAGGTITRG